MRWQSFRSLSSGWLFSGVGKPHRHARRLWRRRDEVIVSQQTSLDKAMTVDHTPRVLFVDLDHTLVANDVLWLMTTLMIRSNPRILLHLLKGLLSGRGAMKRQLARHITPVPAQLPFREDVLRLVQQEKNNGRTVVLATATDMLWARVIARYVGLFDDVLASCDKHNLKGIAKLKAIQGYCRAHDFDSFDYVGDSMADLPIWQCATKRYAIAPSQRVLSALAASGIRAQIIGVCPSRLQRLARLIGR